MNSDRIKEIQQMTAYPDSVSVKLALLQVWNECEQDKANEIEEKIKRTKQLEDALKDSQIIMKNLKHNAKDSSAPIYFGGVSLDKALDTNWNLIKTTTP